KSEKKIIQNIQKLKKNRRAKLTKTSFLNSIISTSSSCLSTNSNSPSSAEVPAWTFSSGTLRGGVRATTRALVDLRGDGTADPPTVSSGSRSEVEGPPPVPYAGCPEASCTCTHPHQA